MSSIAKATKRSKKTKRLGPVQILRPEEYAEFDVETKVECIQALIPLGLMRIQELLEDEVQTLAGVRYERKTPSRLPARILKRSAPPLFLFYSHSFGGVAFFMDELGRG